MKETASQTGREFRIDHRAYSRHAYRRGALELGVAFGVAWVMTASGWLNALPSWLRVTLACAAVAYVVIGLALVPKAVRTVSAIRVRLDDQGLVYSVGERSETWKYDDSTVIGVARRWGKIRALVLRSSAGQSVHLSNFQNMDQLYSELADHMERRTSPALTRGGDP